MENEVGRPGDYHLSRSDGSRFLACGAILRRCFGLFCVLCVAQICFALDREAFTFTNYDLNVRVEPEQQRLGARGKVTLRNDSSSPQKIAVLQISSSLNWRSIKIGGKIGGKAPQFVVQSFTSDIDHTGALSEALITLPEAVAPKGTIDLEIAYEGVIVLNATRLTRIGTPEAAASSTDWDQISAKFTAVRGVGYVVWYPIATEAADLAGGGNLFEVLGRWKTREADSSMHLGFALRTDEANEKPEVVMNATSCPTAHEVAHEFVADCTYRSLGSVVPAIVIAGYEVVDRPSIAVHFLPGHDAAAATYADSAEKDLPLITEWFGGPQGKAETADLSDAHAAPYESGSLLLMPLTGTGSKLAGLAAAHQLTHAAFSSPRAWVYEGLAHFAQALYVEQQSGRQSALDYIGLHRSALSAIEKENQTATSAPRAEDESKGSLINTSDEETLPAARPCASGGCCAR